MISILILQALTIILPVVTIILHSVLWVMYWKRANRRPVIACEGFPCTKHREYGTLWCKKHQPRKLQLKTLEERLL